MNNSIYRVLMEFPFLFLFYAYLQRKDLFLPRDDQGLKWKSHRNFTVFIYPFTGFTKEWEDIQHGSTDFGFFFLLSLKQDE